MKFLKAVIILLIILATFSCVTMTTGNKNKSDFKFLNDDYNFKSGTICIIPAVSSKVSKYLSKEIIENLKSNSNLDVKDYSFAENLILLDENFIKLQKYRSYMLSQEELDNLLNSQRKLKCDYIYLVWINNLTKVTENASAEYFAEIMGSLIKYPENKQIGYTKTIFSKKAADIIFNRANDNEEIEKVLNKATLKISKKFIKETNSAK